jgi:hypothetical protein
MRMASQADFLRPTDGSRRIAAISTLFLLVGTLSLLATSWNVLALAAWPSAIGHPTWHDLLYGAVFTAGAFGTVRLLETRSRPGAFVAAMWFLAPFVGFFTHDPPGLLPVVLNSLGLATIASLWHRLR